ncbi:MAG TPA: zinc transporter ZupT [Mollicutes bacterium]|jgi:ZIP family zinc transporter|nr:zinc transporter ZupT [Mollicutes bacterium]
MNISTNNIVIAFVLSMIAGLSTALGGSIGLFAKKSNTKFLSVMLGFSAGVMIFISFIEILDESMKLLILSFDKKSGSLLALICFFSGMLLVHVINRLIPNDIYSKNKEGKRNLMRTGILTAVVVAIHNFPEGIASFITSLRSLSLAIPTVLAIALHNIPEGIAVSVPIYHATGSRERAFLYSLLSGIAEPLGALVGYIILIPFMNDVVFGILYALIAGIMVFISFDQLIPTSNEYGKHSLSIIGLITGMVFMGFSLWLFI